MIDLVKLHGVATDSGVWSGLTEVQRALVIMECNGGELVTYRHTNDVEIRFRLSMDSSSVWIRRKVLKDLVKLRMVKRFFKYNYPVDSSVINNPSMINIYAINDRGIKAAESVVVAMKLVEELSHA